MVDYVKGCNANAIILEVRKRGDAYYVSTLEPAGVNMTPAAGYDCLADVIAKAHAAGLEVHAWVVVYRVWTFQTPPATTTPNHVFNTHPEWFNLTDTGAKFDAGNNSFLDPGNPGVEDFNTNVFMEIVRNYDIDGLCLDYIRYPGTTWGYNATSVARYNAEYGLSGNPSASNTQWSNWRRDQITNMVKRVYLEAKAIKPNIKVGAAVWKTSPTGDSGYFQNWGLWMQNHWMDYACPMNYTTTNSTYDSNNTDNFNRMYGHHVYPAQGSYMNTIANSMVQIASTQSMGFPGVTPYSYAVTNSGTVDRVGFQNSLLAGPFATPVAVPAMPWISTPTTGMLKGIIKDVSGSPVYPATVTIASSSTKNSGTGFYGFVDLTPGTYTVSATAPGQPNGSGTITITAGQVATLDITLGQVDSEPPTVPANLNAVAASSTTVNLTWTASTDNVGVTGYKIYRNDVQIGTSTTNSYTDATCTPNTTYSYQVSAYDAKGNESTKSALAVTTTPADTTAPSVPGSLAASAVSASQINLSWSASTDNVGVTGYKVYRDGAYLTTVTGTSYSDTSLAQYTTYSYTVSAIDAAANESAQSSTASATTWDAQAPTVPAGLTATAASQTQVNLAWTASTDNAGVTGYNIYRGGVKIGTSATISYSDTTCSPNTTYSYTVSAYDARNNESAQSAPASATTPGITVKNYAPASVALTRGTVSSGTVANLAANDSSYLVISGAASGKTYYADWYSAVSIAETPASITKLTLTFDGKLSTSLAQKLYVYNWTTAAWVQIDSRTVGTSDTTIAWSTTTPAAYISSSGEIRLRQYVTRRGSFSSSSDLAQFTVEF